MKEIKKTKEKKVKISITLSPDLDKRMEDELTNKSRLIEKLLREYYGNKDLY
jgi:metal-responsive CopG/Arc/MetJ family transcriptional regulator